MAEKVRREEDHPFPRTVEERNARLTCDLCKKALDRNDRLHAEVEALRGKVEMAHQRMDAHLRESVNLLAGSPAGQTEPPATTEFILADAIVLDDQGRPHVDPHLDTVDFDKTPWKEASDQPEPVARICSLDEAAIRANDREALPCPLCDGEAEEAYSELVDDGGYSCSTDSCPVSSMAFALEVWNALPRASAIRADERRKVIAEVEAAWDRTVDVDLGEFIAALAALKEATK